MLTLHKDDLREANITPFQGRGRPPVHNLGDAPIKALVTICPQESDFIFPQLRPTYDEEAVAEEDVGRGSHPYEAFGSETHRPRSKAFWTSRANKIPKGLPTARNPDGRLKDTNQRCFTPDVRQQASVAERFRVERHREFFEENKERLDAAYAR